MRKVEDNLKVATRLKSVSGHLSSVVRMVEKGEDAEAVLLQLKAVQAALNKIDILVYNHELEAFANYMRNNSSEPERLQNALRLLRLFSFSHQKR